MEYMAINYLDDFGGAETREKAQDAFDTLENLSKLCGLEESVEKFTLNRLLLGMITESFYPDKVILK
jgi:hypothetical protein